MAERKQDDDIEVFERTRVDAHDLSWALRAVMRAHDDVDRELARRLGLRPLDYAAMDQAMSSPTAIGPGEMSEHLGISTGSTTEMLDRLERAGHIRRDPHPTDRRRVQVQASSDSVQRIIGTLQPLLTSLDQLAADFTPAEQQAIRRYLRAAEKLLREYAS